MATRVCNKRLMSVILAVSFMRVTSSTSMPQFWMSISSNTRSAALKKWNSSNVWKIFSWSSMLQERYKVLSYIVQLTIPNVTHLLTLVLSWNEAFSSLNKIPRWWLLIPELKNRLLWLNRKTQIWFDFERKIGSYFFSTDPNEFLCQVFPGSRNKICCFLQKHWTLMNSLNVPIKA